ncbi:MAG: hypothetical protein AB8G05_06095 [Oligoflexales bacterium]
MDSLSLSWQDAFLLVTIPQRDIEIWANSDQVGIYGQDGKDKMEAAKVSVEKDFRWLQPRPGNDDLDTFDHPVTNC